MKKYKITSMVCCAVLLLLEILPMGAVLIFAGEGGDTVRKTYSYFSLIPYGYANFGPFLSALMTVILSVLTFISLFKNKRRLHSACTLTSLIALITSLLPLTFGVKYFPPTAALITLILSTITVMNFFLKNHKGEQI